jgi:outer membrane autotransporter protein
MKNNIHAKSHLNILKQGKMSLVVSSLLISCAVVTPSFADAPPPLVTHDASTSYTLASNETLTSTEREIALYLNGVLGIDKSITINGKIDITNTDDSIGISTNNSTPGKIINNGTINVKGGKALGIKIVNHIGKVINNGDIMVNSYADYYHYSRGIKTNGSSSEASILNIGTISATKNGKADVSAFSIASLSPATIDNQGILNGNIFTSGTLTNSGTISLPHNARQGNSSRIITFTNTSSGILEIGLQTDGTTTTHSQLSTNNATFEDGSTINVNVLSTSTNTELLVGETLEDVVSIDSQLSEIKSSSNLTIVGKLNITDNSALLDFKRIINEKDNNTIDLIGVNARKKDNILAAIKLGSAGTNTQGAATALDSIQSQNNPQMNEVFSALNKLSSNEKVAKAVESTTPQTTAATVGAAGQISNGISGIVEQRQNVVMGGGLNSGDEMFSNKNSWVKTFGSFGSQDNVDGLNGFDVKAYGIGMGIDAEVKENQTLGFAFFYTNASVDVNNVSQTSDLDVFTTLVYGNAPIIDDKTKFLYQVGYAWQKTAGERDVFTGDKASSKYTSKTASLDLKIVRDYKVNDKLLLQPMVSTTYRHFTNPEYSETGAGALNLNVQKFTSSELIASLGTMSYYKLDEKSKIIGNVNVGYDFHDRQQGVTSAYQGASTVTFDTTGIDNGRWSYEAGVGYERDINENSNINFSYNYQAQGSSFANNTISAKYVYKF